MLHQFFIIYIIVINSIAYLAMIIDKLKSKRNAERIPESNLLLLAILMGAMGVLIGMLAPVNHKSSKWKFKILVPTIVIADVFFIYFMETKVFGI